jgi:hypothetical protein
MHNCESPKNGVIPDVHMTGELRIVGKYGVMTNLAIVGQMYIGHDPVVITDTGYPGILRGAAIESAKFAYRITIANLKLRWFTLIFLVLRRFAQGRKLINAVIGTYPGMAGDHHVRADDASGTDFDIAPDHRVWTDFDISS